MVGRSYKERAVSGVFWNFLFVIMAAPVGYLVRILYDRNLSLVEIGLFYAVLDLMSILAIIRELGLSYSLIHFIPKFLAKKRKDLVKATILTVSIIQGAAGLVITAATIIFSRQIVLYYLSKKTIIPDIRIAVAAIIICAISSLIDCFTSINIHSILGFQKQRIYSSIGFVKIIIVAIISFFGIYFLGIKSAIAPSVAYLVMPALILIIYSIIFLKKVFPNFFEIKGKPNLKLAKEISRYAIPLALTSIGTIIMTSIDGICLTYLSGLEQVGIYKNAVVPTSNFLVYFTGAVSVVLFPMISELWAKNKKKEIAEGLKKALSYVMIAVMPLSIFMAAFPTVILNILWTSKNISGASALRFLSIAAIFLTLYSLFSNFIRATGDSKTPMKILYAGAVFNLIGNLIVIPKMGMTGAALTTMLGYLLTAALAYVYVKRKIQIRIEWKKIGMALCASLISVGSIILVKNISENLIIKLLISGAAYFGTYIVIIFITRTINIEEIKGTIAKK
jgi:O-antigen/teichoic acid export membrane protein